MVINKIKKTIDNLSFKNLSLKLSQFENSKTNTKYINYDV